MQEFSNFENLQFVKNIKFSIFQNMSFYYRDLRSKKKLLQFTQGITKNKNWQESENLNISQIFTLTRFLFGRDHFELNDYFLAKIG
jgi:hypothetical protein